MFVCELRGPDKFLTFTTALVPVRGIWSRFGPGWKHWANLWNQFKELVEIQNLLDGLVEPVNQSKDLEPVQATDLCLQPVWEIGRASEPVRSPVRVSELDGEIGKGLGPVTGHGGTSEPV